MTGLTGKKDWKSSAFWLPVDESGKIEGDFAGGGAVGLQG